MAVADNNDNGKSQPTVEFLTALFQHTEAPIFLQTLANNPDDPDEGPNRRHLMSRDIEAIERFVAKHDRSRRGTFVCVSTMREGSSTRSKDNAAECVGLHADLDFKGIEEPLAAIVEAVAGLECAPSIEVQSGGGMHLYWLFREPLEAQEYRDRIEAALRRLAEVLAGDLAVCEISRLMRLPGTHNSKYGDMRKVTFRHDADIRYELEDLEDWLDRQKPVLQRKAAVEKSAAAQRSPKAKPENPFLAAAAAMGRKPRLDVDEALAAMAEGNIHDTQVRVSAALLARGEDVEDVVAILMEATRQASGDNKKWNWEAEEKRIRTACAGAIKKFPPPVAPYPETEPEPVSHETVREDDNVADLGVERAKRQPKPKPRRGKINHLDIGEIFLTGLRASGEGLMFTETQGAWRYADGLWRLQDDRALRVWIDRQIEQCILGTEAKSRLSLVNETRAWLMRHDDLYAGDVLFDAHGQVPTLSGLVDPLTGDVTPPHPGQFCTWRIEAEYDPKAACPWWLKMLDNVLADRSFDVAREYIDLLQEMLGAGLVDAKPRSLSKALIFQGGSNAGKSGLLEVMAGLFGAEQNTAPLDSLDGAHGLMPFTRRLPWVLHEAFDQRKWHFSSTVKAIVTGEAIQINIKNGPVLSRRVTVPVLWGTNNPPQFQEASKAIVSRIVVVRCRIEFDENNPIGAAAEAMRQGLHRPSALVLEREMPGLLAWAVAGLRRALKRGHFQQPAEALDIAHEIRRDSNLVAGFVEDCCEFALDTMVSTSDFCAAFAAWWTEHKGENRSIPSNESVGRALAALGDARVAINAKELKGAQGRRFYAGVKLSEDGLRYWEIATTSDLFKGKTTSATTGGKPVNVPIPPAWEVKSSIEAMTLAHARRGGT